MPDPIERELLEKVYSAPHDDGPRLVYADWLLEHESPRGELIMLQYKKVSHGLTVDEQRRETKLIEEHANEWLGELADIVDREEMSFRRGFLSACNAWMSRAPDSPGLLDSPAWATVERIGGDIDLITHRAMKGLRAAGPLSPGELAELLDRRTPLPSLVELQVEGAAGGSEIDRRLAITAMFPGLLRLACRFPDMFTTTPELTLTLYAEHYQALLRSPLGLQLDSFAVRHPHFLGGLNVDCPPLAPMLISWVRELEEHRSLKRIIVVPTRGLAFRLSRVSAGLSLIVEWHSGYASAHPISIARALVDPEIQRLSSVRVEQHGVHLAHHRAMMDRILAPIPHATFRHHSQSGPDLSHLDPTEEPTQP